MIIETLEQNTYVNAENV